MTERKTKQDAGPTTTTTPSTRKRAQGAAAAAGAVGAQDEPGEAPAAPMSVRFSSAMLEAIGKAVAASPIEFGNKAEFVKRAVESELRRRGFVKTYRE